MTATFESGAGWPIGTSSSIASSALIAAQASVSSWRAGPSRR